MGERDGAGGSKVEGGRWRGEVKGKRDWMGGTGGREGVEGGGGNGGGEREREYI